jgi:hypothetical protein
MATQISISGSAAFSTDSKPFWWDELGTGLGALCGASDDSVAYIPGVAGSFQFSIQNTGGYEGSFGVTDANPNFSSAFLHGLAKKTSIRGGSVNIQDLGGVTNIGSGLNASSQTNIYGQATVILSGDSNDTFIGYNTFLTRGSGGVSRIGALGNGSLVWLDANTDFSSVLAQADGENGAVTVSANGEGGKVTMRADGDGGQAYLTATSIAQVITRHPTESNVAIGSYGYWNTANGHTVATFGMGDHYARQGALFHCHKWTQLAYDGSAGRDIRWGYGSALSMELFAGKYSDNSSSVTIGNAKRIFVGCDTNSDTNKGVVFLGGYDAPTSTDAVVVVGDLRVTGSVSKAAGTFEIPHPIKADYRLLHSFVEAPEYLLIYRVKWQGVEIDLDDHTNLTPGTLKQLGRDWEVIGINGEVSVEGDRTKLNIPEGQLGVTYLVTCVRNDDAVRAINPDTDGYFVCEKAIDLLPEPVLASVPGS